MVSGIFFKSLTANVCATYPTDDILTESLIYSAGIVNVNRPSESETVPILRLITPMLAYRMGSPSALDMTVRLMPGMVMAHNVRKQQILYIIGDFMIGEPDIEIFTNVAYPGHINKSGAPVLGRSGFVLADCCCAGKGL